MQVHETEGLTALEALGIAIRAEIDARAIYEELAHRADEPRIRRRFELLAAEEQQHREYLDQRKAGPRSDRPGARHRSASDRV